MVVEIHEDQPEREAKAALPALQVAQTHGEHFVPRRPVPRLSTDALTCLSRLPGGAGPLGISHSRPGQRRPRAAELPAVRGGVVAPTRRVLGFPPGP